MPDQVRHDNTYSTNSVAGHSSKPRRACTNSAASWPSTTRWSNEDDRFIICRGTTAPPSIIGRSAIRLMPMIATSGRLITGVVAVAQPINGKHYLSDLVVGAAVGWIAEAMVSAVFDRVAPVIETVAVEKLPLLGAPIGKA